MGTAEEKTPLLSSGATEKNYSDHVVFKPGDTKEKGDEEKNTKSATFGEMFQFATCLDYFFMFVGTLAAMVHGSGWPLLSIVFGDMTNDFIGTGNSTFPDMNGTSGNFTPPPIDFEEQMTKYALYYVYIGVGVMVASYLQVSFWTMSCERQVYKLRKAFFKAVLRQEIGWFDEHQSGELTTRLADDMEKLREGIGDKFSLCVQFFSAFISGFVIGFIKGWKLTLVMMSLTPVLAIAGAFMSKAIASFSKREQEKYAEAGSVAEEVLSCVRTVISFNGQKQEIKRYSRALVDSKKLGIRKAAITGVGMGITLFVMFSAYALAFWFGSTEVAKWQETDMEEGLSPGTVFTVFFCVMIGSFSIGNATPHASAIATAKGAAATVVDILKNIPSIDAASDAGVRLQSVKGLIEFRDVEFSYPTRKDVKVMKNFNLTVHPGQTVALVGASGCGKSTTVNLIQRFYDPDSGNVFLDNTNLKELNIRWLRENIGIVSQEPILFGCTIRENILLGNPGATEAAIITSSKQANAHDFISKLPQGYDTLVGERGAQLSGGQKQRVAIARALIRDPKILLLDEATSALDSASEGIVQAALDKAREGRTTIVVAHRLSTIQNADIIYVLQDGEVVEQGKHSELMSHNGPYFQLVTLQTIAEEVDNDDKNSTVQNGHVSDGDSSKHVDLKRRSSRVKSPTVERQTSRQLSRQTSKPKTKEEEAEEEEVTKPGFCRMMQENAPELPFIILGCIAASLNGCTMPLFAVFFSEIVRVFGETGDKLKDDAVFWSLMFLALGGANFLTNSIQTYSFGQSGERLTMRLRLKVFKNILRQDVAYFDDPKHSSGALTTRLATDASMVKNATGIRLATMIQSIVGLIAGLVIAFIFGWKLALVVLGGVPVMALAGAIQMKAVTGNQKRDSELLEDAGKTAAEAVENVRTVQSLTRETHFYERYCSEILKPYKENMKQAHVYGISFGFSQGVVFLLYAGAFRFGAYLVSINDMTADSVYRVFFAIAFTGMAVGQASSFLPDYTKARLSAGLIFKLLDYVPFIDIYSNKGIVQSDVKGDITLKDVQFHYPMRPDVQVLKGLNINIKPGNTAALVGVSGCGKSTVVSLLQRYYDTTGGEIMIDGTNIREFNLATLRSFISVVSQEPILFDCSIRENIAYGLERDVSMAEVIEVTRTANIHEFISNLPQGYETAVGEKGTQLSGGQKQRVAIARALVRNPRILLLDEATSALDTESEQIVQSALDNAREGRTCLVIAHRLSTIQNADVIFMIENGSIIEQGSHLELLAKKGAYSTLVEGQQFNKS
ncbi:ATP-dependent translocase ABCB1-like isoform X1 [Haliotis asinina]|uniref:ATP-dependent translocase ABCB1-like isoform X1 n=1 Tax=Haliotis asinina TaxID=109174 RepID=UPI003531F32F